MIYMEAQQSPFAVKLQELEEEYRLLQNAINACQGRETQEIRRCLRQVQDTFQKENRLLALSVNNSSLPCVSSLARIYLDAWERAKELFHTQFCRDMAGKNPTGKQDCSEALALYTEYAIDFASQAMHYALGCALNAIELQNQAAGQPDSSTLPPDGTHTKYKEETHI